MPHIRRRYKIFLSVENLKDVNCSSKIHCQIDLLLIWSTFLQLTLTPTLPSSLPRYNIFIATFTSQQQSLIFCSCCSWLDNIILSHIFYICASQNSRSIFLQHFITIDMTGAVRWPGKEKINRKAENFFFFPRMITFRQLNCYKHLTPDMKVIQSRVSFSALIHDKIYKWWGRDTFAKWRIWTFQC